MITRYQLNQDNHPTIPCVHDCVVKEIKIQSDFLTFYFEDDINQRNSIQYYNPKAKSLVIRYHLIGDFEVFVWKRKLSLLKREGYIAVTREKLVDMTKYNLEYLYHNIGYQSIILKLWSQDPVVVDLMTDYIEYEWIE